jgi:dipeptidyl aminopeptidase/acylaminoacyl peptidase
MDPVNRQLVPHQPETTDLPSFRSFVPTQRFQPGLALSPDATRVAYSSNADGQFDLWLHPLAGGDPQRLTRHDGQAVRQIAWAPDGAFLVFTADTAGDEQYQIYRIPADGGPSEPIATAPGQHKLGRAPFDPQGRLLVYAANDRDPAVQDLIVHSLWTGERQRHTPPNGSTFEPYGISPDGRWLLIAGARSNTEADCYLLDLTDPDAAPASVTGGPQGGYFWPESWAPDSQGFYLTTSACREFIAAAYYQLDTATLRPVTSSEWDVETITARNDVLLWSINQAGTSIPKAQRHGQDLALPSLPTGVITAIDLAHDASLAVVQLEAATRPAEIGVMDLRQQTFRYLTDTRPAGLHTIRPVEPTTYADALPVCACRRSRVRASRRLLAWK